MSEQQLNYAVGLAVVGTIPLLVGFVAWCGPEGRARKFGRAAAIFGMVMLFPLILNLWLRAVVG